MHGSFKFIVFFIMFSLNNSLYSAVNHSNSLNKMSCCELMHALIEDSSFGETFKKLNLALAFERDNEWRVGIKIAKKLENEDRYGVYGNYDLDLVNATLNYIDREPQIPIKINKKYIPFIAAKCTREENEYINTGRLPDENGD